MIVALAWGILWLALTLALFGLGLYLITQIIDWLQDR